MTKQLSTRRLLPLLFSGLAFLLSGIQHATAQSLCENRGYVIGFFNGVWNQPTPDGALGALEALRALTGDTKNGEPIEFELFYNHTGSTVNSNFLQDLAETFIQRAQELDTSGKMAARFDFFWEVLSDGDRNLWDKLIQSVPAALGTYEALYEDLMTKSVAGYSLLLSDPPTQSDYAEHNAHLDELILQGYKILLVAHSQGNLFVNHAYDYAVEKTSAESLQVVHIAPASPTLRGEHKLADIDLVINALRLQGLDSVPPSNLYMLPSLRDKSGHKLIDTYLDERRSGRQAVKDLMENSLAALATPPVQAGIGFFTVTLKWDGLGDVDLHTFEPDGSHVYYGSLLGTSGHLDVDNTYGYGPEHYYASCEAEKLRVGTYSIGINNYYGATGREATIQASSARLGVLDTKIMDVGPQRGSSGNNSPMYVFDVVVSKDDRGNYSVNIQR